MIICYKINQNQARWIVALSAAFYLPILLTKQIKQTITKKVMISNDLDNSDLGKNLIIFVMVTRSFVSLVILWVLLRPNTSMEAVWLRKGCMKVNNQNNGVRAYHNTCTNNLMYSIHSVLNSFWAFCCLLWLFM